MCQARLISAPVHTYQFQYVYTLGIRKYSFEMCQERLISVPDHTFQFQNVHRLGIGKY